MQKRLVQDLLKIKDAYEILINPVKRIEYDIKRAQSKKSQGTHNNLLFLLYFLSYFSYSTSVELVKESPYFSRDFTGETHKFHWDTAMRFVGNSFVCDMRTEDTHKDVGSSFMGSRNALNNQYTPFWTPSSQVSDDPHGLYTDAESAIGLPTP